jgi:transposase
LIDASSWNGENLSKILDENLNKWKYELNNNDYYLLMDIDSFHTSKIVKESIERNKIKVIFLPTCSPSINHIVNLFFLFKKKLYSKTINTIKDLKKKSEEIKINIGEKIYS